MSDECPICMENLSDSMAVGLLACCSNSRFCADCIVKWGKERDNRCPMCRGDFFEVVCMKGTSCWTVKISRRKERKELSEDSEEDAVNNSSCCLCERMIYDCRGGMLVECDECQRDFCLDCLGLEDSTSLPEGDWFCGSCEREGTRRRGADRRAEGGQLDANDAAEEENNAEISQATLIGESKNREEKGGAAAGALKDESEPERVGRSTQSGLSQ
ncbi:hypothetical protein GUITHDRAFT_141740 [Guillardia theta CCMP2712]|uniref:RING-type domain-containing protein n=2 Tax=Guillardia theta TaxID=55529 RepID=L1IZP1_GUITC|nr:hypothetical protein GUITHDRAFT_141740 [Guillardia theta CCMP2712]EKX41743.1 hypothetical protein GUITHDRAFT_141740 [Guillardia theta CCMP2712]|eukprot:XP_005828723.1 hypothetical protein GUITHDRAFT_141740 [Guillardia theta CCMP2712]